MATTIWPLFLPVWQSLKDTPSLKFLVDFGVWFRRWIFWWFFMWIFSGHFPLENKQQKIHRKIHQEKLTVFKATFWPKSTQGNFCPDNPLSQIFGLVACDHLSSGAWRGAPDGVATLKARKAAFDALNKGSEALGSEVKLSPLRGRPEELYEFSAPDVTSIRSHPDCPETSSVFLFENSCVM